MMNKKAAMDGLGIGGIIMVAITIIVGLILLAGSNGSIAGNVGSVTTLQTSSNQLITFPANGATLELLGQNINGAAVITNRTGAETVAASNYTVTQKIGADGLTATVLTGKAGLYGGTPVNITYTYEPDGYLSSSSDRSIAGIIVILAALAIALITLVPVLKTKVLNN